MGPVESLLRAALAVYRERGGAVGTYEDRAGRVCAVGAVRVSLTGSAWTPPDRNQPTVVAFELLEAAAFEFLNDPAEKS